MQVCTVVATRDLPRARVMAESFRRHHPDAPPVVTLVLDGATDHPAGTNEPCMVVRPDDLELGPQDFFRLAMSYDQPELVEALKPWLLTFVLDRGAPVALYLDAAFEVFARFDEVPELATEHGLVVVPSLTAPLPDDAREPSARAVLSTGPYNPGFVAVTELARPMLRWFQARECTAGLEGIDADASGHRFWGDLVTSVFAHRTLRDPGYGVGYWNVHDRAITHAADGPAVDGVPLRCFHFRDYDPERPHELFAYHGTPRVTLAERPDLAELCRHYSERLRGAGLHAPSPPYGFGQLSDGSPIDARMRRHYRESLARFERGAGAEPPNPFDDEGLFVAWLNEPIRPEHHPVVSRYLERLWSDDGGLPTAYFELTGETAERFLRWCATTDRPIPAAVRPSLDDVERLQRRRQLGRPRGPAPTGVNVVGYLRSAIGLGAVGRTLVEAFRVGGQATSVLDHSSVPGERLETMPGGQSGSDPAPFDLNVVCVNAMEFPELARALGPELFAARRTAGLWFWEVERFPESMHHPAFDLVDEVWVASDFVRDAIEPLSPKPVIKVPIPIVVPELPTDVGRHELGIPEDRFVFAFAFDFLSVADRKNPYGLIEAYRRAFQPDDGAHLVIKSTNSREDFASFERLMLAAAGRSDIAILDGYLPVSSQHAFFAACDAYVSLHRSEGFGLTIAEAMAFAKPVIVTGYSGNLEFTNATNSYLVDWTLTPVGPGHYPYPAEARWADPDLEHASTLMRSVFENPESARRRGALARDEIRRWSVAAVAPALTAECDAARARALGTPATWRGYFMRGWRTVHNPEFRREYEYDWLPDGTPVDDSIQRSLHAFLDEARAGNGRPAPNPDQVGGSTALRAWLNEPISPGLDPCLTRYFVQYWRDHDELVRLFPGVDQTPADARAFVARLRESWYEATDIPYQLAPEPPPPPTSPAERVRLIARKAAQRVLGR
jgi:glycosyltransferase involved in cell wall biosynthesis